MHLGFGERRAVLIGGGDELAEQVGAGFGAALGDQAGEKLRELLTAFGGVGGVLSCEQGVDIGDHFLESWPLAQGDTEQLAERSGGERAGEVTLEVHRRTVRDESGECGVGEPLHARTEGEDPPGTQGAGQHPPQPRVRRAVHEEQHAGVVGLVYIHRHAGDVRSEPGIDEDCAYVRVAGEQPCGPAVELDPADRCTAAQLGQLVRRVQARSGLPDPPPPRAAVRALLIQLLPLDEPRREEGHSLYALLAGGLRHGELGQRLRTGMAQLREFLTNQVAAGKVASDPEAAATTLMALTDGLAAHVLSGFLPPEAAETALDAQLDTVFGPETSS